MALTISVHYGPIEAEITGEEWDEIQEDMEGLIGFVEDHEEIFGRPELETESGDRPESLSVEDEYWEEVSQEENSSSLAQEDHPLSSLARQVGTSTDDLEEIVYVDPESEELPQILVDKGELGGNKTERQRKGAYIILKVWEDCYGEERMKTSQLKEILTMAGISDSNIFNAWGGPGKGDFDPKGSGASATVKLTGPGNRKSIETLRNLLEDGSD